jgi:hypothetical protein
MPKLLSVNERESLKQVACVARPFIQAIPSERASTITQLTGRKRRQ